VPLPKIDQGVQVFDFADRPPRIDTTQEQHLCGKPGSKAGRG
jgi:hypothetical protein